MRKTHNRPHSERTYEDRLLDSVKKGETNIKDCSKKVQRMFKKLKFNQ